MTVNWSPPNWLWGYFVPLGLLLLMWGGFHPRKARRITFLAAYTLAVAALCYWAVGFAFHMGGAQAVQPDNPALKGLGILFTILPDQPGWGFIGLDGFFLAGDSIGSEVFGFFLSYLPLITTSVLLVTLVLFDLRRWIGIVSGFLIATVIVPVALCWTWGSGWLAHLGETMGFGYGYVDFGGSSIILWVPALVALGILLVQKKHKDQDAMPANPPTSYAPLLANLGAVVMGLGWMGWILSNPFHIAGANLDWGRTALNMLLGMAGAILTSQLYAWLVTGAPEVLLASRGLVAGWAGLIVGAPFLSTWMSLLVGLFAGLVFPFIHFAIDSRARLRGSAGSLALGLTAGPLGALSVGFFADGRWGQAWNTMTTGADTLLEGTDQMPLGVAGLFVTGNAGQLKAQIIGLAALGLWGLIWGVMVGIAVRMLVPEAA
ncbi:MAG: hypothetical protein P1S60_13585, partial [Anaerolineae bacterium]|nr:hypothetical protein [Anaerolineae bacterium]